MAVVTDVMAVVTDVMAVVTTPKIKIFIYVLSVYQGTKCHVDKYGNYSSYEMGTRASTTPGQGAVDQAPSSNYIWFSHFDYSKQWN